MAIAALAVVTGCANPDAPGPMELGGDLGEYCIGTDGDTMTVGDVFTIDDAADATLERVSLRNPEGLELEGSYVAPVTDLAFGTDTYPPSNPLWDTRTDVNGARITPGTTYSFILVLRPTGNGPHTAEGFDVTYEASGTSYRKQNTTGYVLQKDCIS